MTRPEKSEELSRFITEISAGDAKRSAANEEVISRFKKAELNAPAAVKNRIRALLGAQREPAPRSFWKKAAPALAACAAALILAVSLHSPHRRVAELSPDWRSYDNYPSYADEARLYLMDIQPDWRASYNFPGGADFQGR
ncbi:MAG: hypothetical protein Q7R35_14040 [Elusimicrobiota bacterium]|nr:hypothetical protein [Elusimicrobiota bacterium]